MAATLRCSSNLASAVVRLSIRQSRPLSNAIRLDKPSIIQLTSGQMRSGKLSASTNRLLSTSARCFSKESQERAEKEEEAEGEKAEDDSAKKRPIVDVQTSIKYMNSGAYKITYGNAKVWEPYRRNFKGQIPPKKTRKTCIRKGVISTGNPCPICRDEFLVLHPENVDLLKQFVSPHTGDIISFQKTGLCQKQHDNLIIAMHQAYDLGTIERVVPFRTYDYSEYYPELRSKKEDTKESS